MNKWQGNICRFRKQMMTGKSLHLLHCTAPSKNTCKKFLALSPGPPSFSQQCYRKARNGAGNEARDLLLYQQILIKEILSTSGLMCDWALQNICKALGMPFLLLFFACMDPQDLLELYSSVERQWS